MQSVFNFHNVLSRVLLIITFNVKSLCALVKICIDIGSSCAVHVIIQQDSVCYYIIMIKLCTETIHLVIKLVTRARIT